MYRLYLLGCCALFALPLSAQNWTGQYASAEPEASLQLKQVATTLTGEIMIGGEKAAVNGKITGNTAKGELKDEQDTFTFEAQLAGDALTLSFTSAKLLYVPIKLHFQRQKAIVTPAPSEKASPKLANGPGAPADKRVVGTWRYTEVMSSGSGGNYFSLATDYFLQLEPNGQCATWTGKSGGGGANSSVVGNGGPVERGHYKTSNGQLILIDPATKQEAAVPYSVDATRLLLSGNGQKRIYERVQ